MTNVKRKKKYPKISDISQMAIKFQIEKVVKQKSFSNAKKGGKNGLQAKR
jgi:hypothetical protein